MKKESVLLENLPLTNFIGEPNKTGKEIKQTNCWGLIIVPLLILVAIIYFIFN